MEAVLLCCRLDVAQAALREIDDKSQFHQFNLAIPTNMPSLVDFITSGHIIHVEQFGRCVDLKGPNGNSLPGLISVFSIE